MNRQAFAEIERINVRVEERRLGGDGRGNWRVHEFTGFDAIPARLRASFGSPSEVQANALAMDAHLRDLYQRGKDGGRIDAPYEVACGEAGAGKLRVMRTVTISLHYRRRQQTLAKAA